MWKTVLSLVFVSFVTVNLRLLSDCHVVIL